jgi:hypothetical protein
MMHAPLSIAHYGLGLLCFISLVSCTGSTAPGTTTASEQVLAVFDGGTITKVRDVQKNKNHFAVNVQGKVGAQAPLMGGVLAYEVKDDTGSIWVVTADQVPAQGTSVVVRGTVRFQKIQIEGQDQSAVYLEQQKAQRSS